MVLGRRSGSRLTAGEVFEGTVTSPSLLAISHNAEKMSVACSRSPSTKSSTFLSTLARVTSVVESSIQADASWFMYKLLISSYLCPTVNTPPTIVECPAHWEANRLNDSSAISHFPSSLRMWFRARVFRVGTSYCCESSSDTGAPSGLRSPGTDFVRESVDGLWGRSGDLIVGGCDNLRASRSAILVGPKWCKLYRIRVKIHQKRLEPGMTSTKYRRNFWFALTSRVPCRGFLQLSLSRYAPRAPHRESFCLCQGSQTG